MAIFTIIDSKLELVICWRVQKVLKTAVKFIIAVLVSVQYARVCQAMPNGGILVLQQYFENQALTAHSVMCGVCHVGLVLTPCLSPPGDS